MGATERKQEKCKASLSWQPQAIRRAWLPLKPQPQAAECLPRAGVETQSDSGAYGIILKEDL